MKILFCNHNLTIKTSLENIHRPTISLPLGNLSMAAYLRHMKWQGEIDFYDARLSGKITKTSDGDTIFGDLDFEIGSRFKKANPDIIAISNMFSWQIDNAFNMARIAKKVCPKAKVCMGGPHVSSFPKEALNEAHVDYVFMGEGEERMFEFLNCLEQGRKVAISGVLGKEDDLKLLRPNKKNPIGFIKDLDNLPIPAYDLVDVNRYLYLQSSGFSPRPYEFGKRAFSILTSRGCPHQCVFCSIQATMGYKWRHNSPEYVKKHIKYISEKYNCDFIHFEDDNFTYDPQRYDMILDDLLKMDKKIPWNTPNGIRGDSWTYERVIKTKQSGCQYLTVAIESSVQGVLDNIVKKKLNIDEVKKLIKFCQKAKLRLTAFYVIGLPGETKDNIMDTITFALDQWDRYGVLPCINIVKALPGTELYDQVIANKYYNRELKFKPNEIVTKDFDPIWIEEKYTWAMRQIKLIRYKRVLRNPFEVFYLVKVLKEKLIHKYAVKFKTKVQGAL